MNRSVARENLKLLGLTVAMGLAALGGASGYWSFSMSGGTHAMQWWIGWFQDVGTEMIGAAVTIVLVELVIYQKRDEASRLDRERMRRRDHFVTQLKRSRTPEQQKKILERLKRQGLLKGAWLYETDLVEANLQDSDLEDADFFGSNLSKASFRNSNLQNSNLRQANLSHADLSEVNLAGADLSEANLDGANLTGATLKNASLDTITLSPSTCLPDGSFWHPDLKIELFT